MKKSSSIKSLLIVGFWIGLCTVCGLSVADADEVILHKIVAVKGQIVAALQEGDIGYDEERLKRRLGVKSLRGANLSGLDLRWLYLQETDLAKANLQGANLKGANLSEKQTCEGPIYAGQIFPVQTLQDVDLRGANLTGAQKSRHQIRLLQPSMIKRQNFRKV